MNTYYSDCIYIYIYVFIVYTPHAATYCYTDNKKVICYICCCFSYIYINYLFLQFQSVLITNFKPIPNLNS